MRSVVENDIISQNILKHRKLLGWTQEHLAAAARVDTRTIQRAEAGHSIRAETLTAIAGALDVPIELLRAHPDEFWAQLLGIPRDAVTPERIQAKVEEVKARYACVKLTLVTQSAHLSAVFEAEAMYFDCEPSEDAIQDCAADLQSELRDLMDAANVADASGRRELLKSTFEQVEELRSLGYVVSLGLWEHALRLRPGDAIPWSSLFVIVTREDLAREFVMHDKRATIRFG